MKLHEDKDSFRALMGMIHNQTGMRSDILEKDYYVTLLLEELAAMQKNLPAYFKGGTALYKALGNIRRFSEDIDLTVCIEGCSNSQAKKRLENSSNKYKSLQRTENKEMELNQKGSITSVYDYLSVIPQIEQDELQRFGHVKVESTSFTISEPYEELKIAPMLYLKANEQQKKILSDQFDVNSFFIKTIKLERIFADKIFAAEFYFERDMYFDVAKHLYDVAVLMSLEKIQNLIKNPKQLATMLNYKRQEETRWIGSDLDTRSFHDFQIFDRMKENRKLKDSFRTMQEIYVFEEADFLMYSNVEQSLQKMKDVLDGMDEI